MGIGLKYLDNNVFVLGALDIPIYVRFTASLGLKFSFIPKDNELLDDAFLNDAVLICLDKIGDKISDYGSSVKFKNFCKKEVWKCPIKFRGKKQQEFIRLQFDETRSFLNKNPEIIITFADKGGKVVITSNEIYLNKMERFINACPCMKDKIFFPVEIEFDKIRTFVESNFNDLRNKINPFLVNDAMNNFKQCCYQLSFEPFVLARIFGTFKLHKDDIPIRPIISTINSMVKNLRLWLLIKKLELITSVISKYNVKNSREISQKIDGMKLDEGFVPITMDFDACSLFTNVSFGRTKLIIRKYYHLIAQETTVPVELFLIALSFFIEIDAYFSFNGKTYRQCKGLSMGNELSKILADIFVSENLNETMETIPAGVVSSLCIFVDDIKCLIHLLTSQKYYEELQNELETKSRK